VRRLREAAWVALGLVAAALLRGGDAGAPVAVEVSRFR
jgi:hypothetical protein